jgi:hypothetical protein
MFGAVGSVDGLMRQPHRASQSNDVRRLNRLHRMKRCQRWRTQWQFSPYQCLIFPAKKRPEPFSDTVIQDFVATLRQMGTAYSLQSSVPARHYRL